jgi:hypothetical protein
MMASQNSKDKGRLTVKWEVLENTLGYKAIKFINKIVIKIEVISDFLAL